MTSKLFLYNLDYGLFKNILNLSSVIQGRYHVCFEYGNELNTANLNQYLVDPASGLSDVKQKYPCAVCMPPMPILSTDGTGNEGKEIYFQLFFLTLTGRTSDGQIKSMDKDTLTSAHHVWYDIEDMEACAVDFVKMLKQVVRKKIRSKDLSIQVIDDRSQVKPYTKFNVDKVSGVSISFIIRMMEGPCTLADYETDAIDEIIIPEFDLHPLHKQ